MDPADKLKKGISLKAIAQGAKDFAAEGHSPMEVQMYINGARKELAKQLPDDEERGRAVNAARAFKQSKSNM
jgi:hypothetical protein